MRILKRLESPRWTQRADDVVALKPILLGLAARYFVEARGADGRALDSVARFHLGNGARVERLNWAADLSPKGLKQSLGLMVNYLYDLRHVEEQHERFVRGEVSAARRIRRSP